MESSLFSTRAELEVNSDNPDVQNDLFAVLREWMEKSGPPKWQQIWYRIGPVPFFALFWVVTSILITMSYSEANDLYRQEAHALLRDGISPSQQTKAIGLLLALASDYRPQNLTAAKPIWIEVSLWGLFFVSVALTIGPIRAIIGLGHGEHRIRFWRRWLNTVFYIVPIWLVSTAGSAIISNFLTH